MSDSEIEVIAHCMCSLQLQRSPQGILDYCNQAEDLFENVDLTTKSLAAVVPSYGVVFYLRHPEKSEEMIELEVNFRPNEADPGNFEPSKALWRKRGKPDVLSQAPPLEVYNIRLHKYVTRLEACDLN